MASILIYDEPVGVGKALALALIPVSMFLLWKDKRPQAVARSGAREPRFRDVWLRLMLVAFVANGIGPFGLKILSEQGLAAHVPGAVPPRTGIWARSCSRIAALWRSRLRPYGREVWLGALMGACSLLGQAFTGLALSHGVPGHVAFPITTGGSLFLVAAAGLLLFKEKVGAYGMAGMVLGIAALVALSVG